MQRVMAIGWVAVRSRRNRCPDRRKRIVLPARHRHSLRRSSRYTSGSRCWAVMADVCWWFYSRHARHIQAVLGQPMGCIFYSPPVAFYVGGTR